MKKILAVLMVLGLMCSFFCSAEQSVSIEDQAKNAISTVNYFVKEYTGKEQLFTNFQEVAAGQIYGFATADNTLQALVVANLNKNTLDSCSYICDDPQVMSTALNCASLMPFAQLIAGEDDTDMDAIQADMIAMAEWLDENHTAALEAFESNTLYGISYTESEFFYLELMIVPMDEGSRLMATYYFRPAEA